MGTSLDCWLEVMDWSYLHTLKLGWPNTGKNSTLQKLSGGSIPNLKNLIFTGYPESKPSVLKFLINTSYHLKHQCSFQALVEGVEKSIDTSD